MKVTYSTLAAALAAGVAAAPNKRQSMGCSSDVTLSPSSNPFRQRTLFANNFYRSEIEAALPQMSSSMAAKARKVADVGSFLWAYVAPPPPAPCRRASKPGRVLMEDGGC